jgi:murein DD-endopeptidase MepM/ murein hydrolase activator NlpD
MTDQGAAGVSTVFQGGTANALVTQAEYSHVAEGDLQVAIAAYRTDEQQTHAAAVTLEAQQAQASAAAAQLASAGQQAQAALAQDTVLLDQAKSNISVLQAAAAAQAKRAAAQEAALAAQQAQRRLAPPPPAAQVTVAPAPSAPQVQAAATPVAPAAPVTAPGGYADPLRSISGLAPERIDQGVDYQGYGPLYAIGTGVVLNTVNGGWPGGTFITYRLTSGPGAGLVVYAAEDIQPAVQVGQHVTPTTVIGTMYEGPDGIETGWADPAGTGYTMAYDSGQFAGSNSTSFGANFSQLLAALGAPGGVLQNNPPTGTLPGNWPSW